jgi:GH43 family beta-xylosidase
MPDRFEGKPETFINPVYPHSFPDPFVLKFRGEYFGYCTGDTPDGKIFGVLHSVDLVDWHPVGGAMEPLASRPPFYWAPEVVYYNGKFYCYYSAGNEILMEIRVAVSDRPDGGFVDAGVRLTQEEFAIDAHVFIDSDGSRYLFYATDFLEHSHIGTGTVFDRMLDWKTLEGKPRPVTRAKYDWQVYDPARKEKGGVRWHTVEGPTVLKRKGKYFEMFSGGNWQNRSYGVSFAVADSMPSTDEWLQFSDGENILPILRTIPEKVVGPGHNSVVRGPNDRELYCVYHRWTDAGRVLAIDRMDFAGDRLFVAGPTTTEQPLPLFPDIVEDFSLDGRNEKVAYIADMGGYGLIELTFRFAEAADGARFGFTIAADGGDTEFQIMPTDRTAALRQMSGNSAIGISLPPDFDASAWHLLRIDAGLERLTVMIDDISSTAHIPSGGVPTELTVFSEHAHVDISALELTRGFEHLFEDNRLTAAFNIVGDPAIDSGQLTVTPAAGRSEVSVEVNSGDVAFAANIRVEGDDSVYGIAIRADDSRELCGIRASTRGRSVNVTAGEGSADISLPEAFTGNEFRQFSILLQYGRAIAYLDGIELASYAVDRPAASAAVFSDAAVTIEMLRVTDI